MPYLSNAAVNRLNIHTGLHMLAANLAGFFFLVFIMSRGFSVAETFLIYASMLVARFSLRPLVIPCAIRFGLQGTIRIGTLLVALQYVLLIFVDGLNAWLFIFIVIAALADVFYWCSYHAIFGQLGDAAHRGKQLGVRQALTTASAVFAPLIGGWGLQHFGPVATFGLAAAVKLVSLWPLLKLPPMAIARETPQNAFKAARAGAYLFMTDAWIATGLVWGWSIVVFGSSNSNFATVGAVAAVGGLVSVIGNLFLGKMIDAGKHRWLIYANGGCLAFALLLRAAAGREVEMMFAVAAASSLLDAIYLPVFGTIYYNMLQKAPCPLRYTFVTEGAWDTGGIASALLCALIVYFGAAPGWTVAIALLAVPVQALLLKRYYEKDARA